MIAVHAGSSLVSPINISTQKTRLVRVLRLLIFMRTGVKIEEIVSWIPHGFLIILNRILTTHLNSFQKMEIRSSEFDFLRNVAQHHPNRSRVPQHNQSTEGARKPSPSTF